MAPTQDMKSHRREAGRAEKAAVDEVESATAKSAEAASHAYRNGGRTVRHGMHVAGEVAETGIDAAEGAAFRGLRATREGALEFMESTAGQVGEVSQKMARTAEEMSEDLRTLMALPAFGGGMQDMQQAVGGMIDRVVKLNLRATQEIFRVANPAAVLEIQQRFMRQYFNGLIEGSAEFLRASRGIADEALRPIEERAQRLRQNEPAQQHQEAAD